MDEEFIAFGNENDEQIDDEEKKAPTLLTSVPAPWLQYNTSQYDYKASSLIRLHNEILTCCEYIAPTSYEMKQRDLVFDEISQIINNLWPQSIVIVFGSQMTKILTPTSDLDIAVLNVPETNTDQAQLLSLLASKFRESGIVSYVEAIIHAKVPIVKLDHLKSKLSIDICINQDSGIKTGNLIRKFVREYPPLRPLVLVLKIFLTQRRLNETYSGGIGSFLLTLMIVSFLQMKQNLASSININIKPSWNLGTLLLEFLQLYGSSFNYYTTGIIINDDGRYVKKSKHCKSDNIHSNNSSNTGSRPNLLYVENPDSPDLDVGRSSYMIVKIRRAFEHANQVLTAALVDRHVTSYLAYIIRTDDIALQGRPPPELRSRRSNADALYSTT